MKRDLPLRLAGTFSIVALDRTAADLGVAVASKFFAVGSVVPWARAGVGAVATQAWVQPRYGIEGLSRMGQAVSPEKVLASLLDEDRTRELRQVGMMDARGHVAQYTGRETPRWAGHHWQELNDSVFAVQGNTIAGPEVLDAMGKGFERSAGPLAERLLAALESGQAAGGDRRGQQSAGLLVVRAPTVSRPGANSRKHPIDAGMDGCSDRYVDLRVDDHPQPIVELRRLWEIWQAWWA